jgi:hypothetical protein
MMRIEAYYRKSSMTQSEAAEALGLRSRGSMRC